MGAADFDAAVLRVLAGVEKKRSALGPAEKDAVAGHEVRFLWGGRGGGALRR